MHMSIVSRNDIRIHFSDNKSFTPSADKAALVDLAPFVPLLSKVYHHTINGLDGKIG